MVTGPNAGATTVQSTATVAGNPSAAFTVSSRPCANIPTTFTDSTVASPGAPIVDHQWVIDDPSAFGSPSGGKPYGTGVTPRLALTFGYSSVSLGVGSDNQPPPELALQLFRKPVNVTMTITDATGQIRTVSQTVRFIDDGYRPTAAHPTPEGCGKPLFSYSSLLSKGNHFKVSPLGDFKVGVGCATIADCLAQVILYRVPVAGRSTANVTRKVVAQTLGGGRLFLHAGASGRVRVHLSRSTRKLLRRQHSLRAKLVLLSLNAAGQRRTSSSRIVTLTR